MNVPIVYRTPDGQRHPAQLSSGYPGNSYGHPVVVMGGTAYDVADMAPNDTLLFATDNPATTDALRRAGYEVIGAGRSST